MKHSLTSFSALCTLHSALHETLHSALCTLHFTKLCTLHSALCTLLCLASLPATAQVVDGHNTSKTLFAEFVPAKITLVSGKYNHQKEANIFLKDGTLLYKSGGTMMTANMDQVHSVEFGKQQFVKVEGKLAEVVDTCKGNSLVLLRLINIQRLNDEILNESNITSINITDQLAVTRDVPADDQLSYPVDDIYFFIVGDKTIRVREGDVRRALGRKKAQAYRSIIDSYGFRWTDPQWLKQLLILLSE